MVNNTPEGWKKVVDFMLEKIKSIDDTVVIEKLYSYNGRLEVVTKDVVSNEISAVIAKAAEKSEYCCELCGKPGRLILDLDKYFVRCESCLNSKNL
jgi:hypothetical protein